MASCERCWADAGGNPEEYTRILQIRTGALMCTPEQQAGVDAEECKHCGRRTVHQHTKQCVNPKCHPVNQESEWMDK